MINKVLKYFDKNAEDPLTIGVYPLGTGLNIERPYRHYWELKQFISYLPKNSALTLLEFGCGAGRWGISLAPYLKKYIGIDISNSQIEVAKKLAQESNLSNVEFKVENLLNLSQINMKLDIFYSAGVFQYLHDNEIEKILKLAKLSFKENGIFIDRSTFIVNKERLERNDDNYFSIYRTKEELIDIFKKNGFELIANDRSYTYLRTKEFFNRKQCQIVFKFCIKYIPTISFYMMRFISKIYSWRMKTEYINEDIGTFSHDFTVYRLIHV